MRKKYACDGFTVIEFAIVLSLFVGAFVLYPLSCWGTSGGRAREAELKANIHTIQIGLERYMTDNNEYPHYLLGGDIEGWMNWHSKWDGVNSAAMSDDRMASNDRVQDPLIAYDYITSYPRNPFVDDGRGIIEHTSVEGSIEAGDGDPRFGYRGDIMGQGLDDPNFFRGANHPGPFFWSEIETRRTLDRGDWMNVPDHFKNEEPFNTEIYYLMGGFADPKTTGAVIRDENVIRTWWPGNFFYKGTSDQELSVQGWTIPVPNTNVGGHYNRYILGGYGSERSYGVDVIRLIWWNPDGERLTWRCPEPFPEDSFYLGYELFMGSFEESGGLPEVFGGGDEWNGPANPYNSGSDGWEDFVYGAPDGVRDGVIIVLTNGSEIDQFTR